MFTLTEQEANNILAMLSELPIKYLSIVNGVRDILVDKFKEKEVKGVNSAVSDKKEELPEYNPDLARS